MIIELLRSQPEIALFASLALGYFIGSFKIGPIQLGGVCGNSTPVTGYTITYALSNILLPLMGPVVVGLAGKFG